MDLFNESIELYLETMEDMTLSMNTVFDFSESMETTEDQIYAEIEEGLGLLTDVYDSFESDPDITDYLYNIMD